MAMALVVIAMAEYEESAGGRENRKRRKIWTRPWLARRVEGSQYNNLVQELALEDQDRYRNWMRLDRNQFLEVLELIKPAIAKQDTNMRAAVPPQDRLAITLRHLATGESQQSLSYQFRVSQCLISSIIPTVCSAIYAALQPSYLSVPATQEAWKKVAADFFRVWNYPSCIGALDGKRILIAKPNNSGSDFYDYKGHCSIVLMALVDADYKFLYCDVGTNGRASDGGVWQKCTLNKALEDKQLNIPNPQNIPYTERLAPYVIVADDAFPLKAWMMKPFKGNDLPYDKLIYNYRHSRARRVSENAFGILVSRFQIFRQPIRTSPDRVRKVTLAALVLHNYLRQNAGCNDIPPEMLDREDTNNGRIVAGEWRNGAGNGWVPLQAPGRRATQEAVAVRDMFCTYFNNEGKIAGQDAMVFRH